MYAQHSPYEIKMKRTLKGYSSNLLRISIPMGDISDTIRRPYAFAKYCFKKQKDKEKAILIIKRVNKVDTILFMKSKTRVDELKFLWG